MRACARSLLPRPQQRHKHASSGLASGLLCGRMNVPLYLLTFAHLICAAGAGHVSLERRRPGEGIRPGRRTCRLYCRVGIGFHLQIHPDGRVNGSHEPSQLSKLFTAWVRTVTVSARRALRPAGNGQQLQCSLLKRHLCRLFQ